jgi:hypothetical protein
MLVDVTVQLDKTQRLLRQLVAAKAGSEANNSAPINCGLFAHELGVDSVSAEAADKDDHSGNEPPASASSDAAESKPRGRRRFPRT